MGHPLAFELAQQVARMLPGDLDHVFFGNSGSEAVDSALKIALAYWQAKGQPQRVRFIGRARGYHGVGFGGISVGGIASNSKQFAAQALPLVDHMAHTHDLTRNAYSRGQPEHGAEFAESLEQLIAKHDAIDHRGGDHRTRRRINGRAHTAQRVSRASARNLRCARHPADL